VYPNPAARSTVIELPDNMGAGYLRICNALGDQVYQARISAGTRQYQVGLEGFVAGMYYVYIETVEGRACRKLIVR
jgi:hypothetical protein